MKLYRPILYICFISIYLIVTSCSKDDNPEAKGFIHLEFLHEVDGQPLVLSDKVFINEAGNPYRVEKLKYYVSNITLTTAVGSSITFPDGYFLVEETSLDKRTRVELPGVATGNYTSLSFTIGVDSARNFSTEMVGELNPNNDMAWNWVSGYKFFMLEGKFTTNTQATAAIVYHIGGNSSLRKVTLTPQTNSLSVSSNQTTEIGIGADVNQLFKAVSVIDLNQINAVMQPGDEADKIAHNYALGMFQLHHVHMRQ